MEIPYLSAYNLFSKVIEVDWLNKSEVEWKKEWFPYIPLVPKSHWNSLENRRKFFEDIKFKHNIQSPEDWGKLAPHTIHHRGSFLKSHHNNSLFESLQSVYPGSVRNVKNLIVRNELETRVVLAFFIAF